MLFGDAGIGTIEVALMDAGLGPGYPLQCLLLSGYWVVVVNNKNKRLYT